MFFGGCALLFVIVWAGALPSDITGSMLFLITFGGLLSFVGDHVPILGKWLGGAILLPMIVGSFLTSFKLIPDMVYEQVNSFMTLGPINVILASAIAGSILSLERGVLKKAIVSILPSVMIVQIFVILFVFAGTFLTGQTILDGVYMTGLPNFCGGSTSSLGAIPDLYGEVFNESILTYSGRFMILLNISNVLCIFCAGILNHIGKKRPSLTGNGKLLKEQTFELPNQKSKENASVQQLLGGCITTFLMYACGSLASHFIPFLNGAAWMIILSMAIKILDLLNDEICMDVQCWQDLMMQMLVPGLIFGVGITSINLEGIGECVSIGGFVIILLGVIGGIVGSLLAAKCFHYHPIDAMIGLGCNSATLGSTGTIGILTVSERMELMPYASIMCRIGGAFMLVFLSLTVPFFAG